MFRLVCSSLIQGQTAASLYVIWRSYAVYFYVFATFKYIMDLQERSSAPNRLGSKRRLVSSCGNQGVPGLTAKLGEDMFHLKISCYGYCIYNSLRLTTPYSLSYSFPNRAATWIFRWPNRAATWCHFVAWRMKITVVNSWIIIINVILIFASSFHPGPSTIPPSTQYHYKNITTICCHGNQSANKTMHHNNLFANKVLSYWLSANN